VDLVITPAGKLVSHSFLGPIPLLVKKTVNTALRNVAPFESFPRLRTGVYPCQVTFHATFGYTKKITGVQISVPNLSLN
jgi:hypothetical protein